MQIAATYGNRIFDIAPFGDFKPLDHIGGGRKIEVDFLGHELRRRWRRDGVFRCGRYHRGHDNGIFERRQHVDRHNVPIVQHHDVTNHVLQLSDIAGPTIGEQAGLHLGCESLETAVLGRRKSIQKTPRDKNDVLAAVAQRWQTNGNNIQSIV